MSIKFKVFRHSYMGFNGTSLLVYGAKDAVLIDATQLLSDCHALVSQIVPMRKNITHVYVSHFHPDQHFGLDVLHYAFPNARIVALPSVVKDIAATAVDKVDMWDGDRLGGDIPCRTTIPAPLEEPKLEVEGEEILFSDGWNGDCANNSVAWIPSLRILDARDVCFDGAHVWTIESNVERRAKWREDLVRLKDFEPRVIIPGHCGETQMRILEEAEKDASRTYTEGVDWCRKYLDVYEEVYSTAKVGSELVNMMRTTYEHVAPIDFGLHWQARLLFPNSSPDWFTPLPGLIGEIFLNPGGGFDGDPSKE